MSASFNLSLDTRAPANPTLLINDGAAVTGTRAVWVRFATSDYLTGANDVSEMKVWGDVDPVSNPAITLTEPASNWFAFTEDVAVMLSAGAGRKYLYSKLRDNVRNESLPFTDFIDLNLSVPVVSVTTAIDRGRISKISPFNAATFTWESSVAFLAYQVRVVPSHGSPHQTGVLIGSTFGSVRTSGASGAANTPLITTITGADLEAASPGNTLKVCKVFTQGLDGVWSP